MRKSADEILSSVSPLIDTLGVVNACKKAGVSVAAYYKARKKAGKAAPPKAAATKKKADDFRAHIESSREALAPGSRAALVFGTPAQLADILSRL